MVDVRNCYNQIVFFLLYRKGKNYLTNIIYLSFLKPQDSDVRLLEFVNSNGQNSTKNNKIINSA